MPLDFGHENTAPPFSMHIFGIRDESNFKHHNSSGHFYYIFISFFTFPKFMCTAFCLQTANANPRSHKNRIARSDDRQKVVALFILLPLYFTDGRKLSLSAGVRGLIRLVNFYHVQSGSQSRKRWRQGCAKSIWSWPKRRN